VEVASSPKHLQRLKRIIHKTPIFTTTCIHIVTVTVLVYKFGLTRTTFEDNILNKSRSIFKKGFIPDRAHNSYI